MGYLMKVNKIKKVTNVKKIKRAEYKIVPKESFLVFHNCPGCGRKTYFQNTKKFRVNANGSQLDVWLVYQCGICKHTLNLTIYKRQRISSIPEEEYKSFLNNDEILALRYGKDIQLFKKNKAVISFKETGIDILKCNGLDLQDITRECSWEDDGGYNGECEIIVIIDNPYGLKIRPEKQIAMASGLSRSQVKKLVQQEKIRLEEVSTKMVTARILKGLCLDKPPGSA